jgi:hypothetical protein
LYRQGGAVGGAHEAEGLDDDLADAVFDILGKHPQRLVRERDAYRIGDIADIVGVPEQLRAVISCHFPLTRPGEVGRQLLRLLRLWLLRSRKALQGSREPASPDCRVPGWWGRMGNKASIENWAPQSGNRRAPFHLNHMESIGWVRSTIFPGSFDLRPTTHSALLAMETQLDVTQSVRRSSAML